MEPDAVAIAVIVRADRRSAGSAWRGMTLRLPFYTNSAVGD
ncbi:hypothetical protein HMPREF1318_0856 [Actinomyces massiliensis F0489]|uniref:Uncharacterized protein n=1 Tax=Actinomyces massiliensis F0489 TaxID=1125718 RepID=J0X5K9_9ACTO|nr:hypothetical protein HMPREF1318_0856 [Actinomyces massiliensis F0489]